jgi:hypothetical protein
MRAILVLLVVAVSVFSQEEEAKPKLHKIYIPYKKLDELLGSDEERVMVPYKEFLELWKLKYGPDRGADKPIVPFAVESAQYDGKVADGIAKFKVILELELFEDKWQRVPLAFKDVAFEEVLVDGEPGVLTPTKSGYDLVLRGKGRHKVEARFVAGIARGKEYATTAFALPSVPLHKLTFRVPGKGTDIKIEPARAHTTVTEGEETVVLAFLGPQRNVKMTWRFQPEEAFKEPPLVFSTDLYDVDVQERILGGTVQFDLEVLRTPASTLTIAVPEKVQVLEVVGANIKTWGFDDQARRRLKVAFHKPVSGRYSLRVGFEGPVEVPGALAAPAFKVEQAARERGFYRVRSAEGVGLRPVGAENVFQIDLNALPKPIRGGARALGFRFPALPFALSLRTERIKPLVSLVSRARLVVDRHSVKLDQVLQFTVERAGIFTLKLEVPKDVVFTKVGTPELVDSQRETTEGDKRFLTLALRGRRLGRFDLPLQAEGKLDLKSGKLAVPLARVVGVDREEGTLGVYMHGSLKASAKATNMVPVEPAQHRRVDSFGAPVPLAFAWRWRGRDVGVDFAIEARKPKVTCDARYTLQAVEARVDVRAALAYNVEFTGVESFRFRVPKALVERIKRVDAPNLREFKHADDPKPEKEGDPETATYTVTLQGPALGEVPVTVEFAEVFPSALKVNESRPVRVPALTPLDVERSRTHVAIRKAPTIKVAASSPDYEEIDATELPAALRSEETFLALRRFEAPASFLLGLTKHEYQPVADIVVRHMHLRTVVRDEESATTNAFFEILNNNRQFLALRLPDGASVLDLMVEGKPKKPRIGGGGVLLVQLPTGLKKDQTFRVGLAYTHRVTTSGGIASDTTLRGPVLPAYEEAAPPFVALLTWSVHYPADWRVSSFTGKVEPTGDAADRGSWLRRAIDALGRTIRPAAPHWGEQTAPPLGVEAYFKDVVPTPRQRNSVEALFVNGTGEAELVITHTTTTARVVQVLLGVLAGAGLVVFLARAFRPSRAGGALVLAALVLLAFAGGGWIQFFNGLLVASAATALLAAWAESRRSKA